MTKAEEALVDLIARSAFDEKESLRPPEMRISSYDGQSDTLKDHWERIGRKVVAELAGKGLTVQAKPKDTEWSMYGC